MADSFRNKTEVSGQVIHYNNSLKNVDSLNNETETVLLGDTKLIYCLELFRWRNKGKNIVSKM